MGNPQFHEHMRMAFRTMRKGEIAWIKIGPKYHNNIYHFHSNKDHVQDKIGDTIWMKLAVDQIKRIPKFLDEKTYEGRVAFFENIREIGKELVTEGEFDNAKDLYSKSLGSLKNMPKQIKDNLNEE